MATSTSMSGYFDSPASSNSRLLHPQHPSFQPSPRFSHTTPMSGLPRNGSPRHPYGPGTTGHLGHSHGPGHVLSLVHPHERIQVPIPPSLRLRKPTSTHNNTSTAHMDHPNSGPWYDNDEFNSHIIGMNSSSLHLDLNGHDNKQYVEDVLSEHSSGLPSRPSLIHSENSDSGRGIGSVAIGSNSGGFYPLSSHGSPYPTSRPLPIPHVDYFNHSGHSGYSTPDASPSPTASPGLQGSKPPFLVLPLPTH